MILGTGVPDCAEQGCLLPVKEKAGCPDYAAPGPCSAARCNERMTARREPGASRSNPFAGAEYLHENIMKIFYLRTGESS